MTSTMSKTMSMQKLTTEKYKKQENRIPKEQTRKTVIGSYLQLLE